MKKLSEVLQGVYVPYKLVWVRS